MKPQPNTNYFNLPPAKASAVALELTKKYDDWDIFREWTGQYDKRKRIKDEQLSLL